MNCSVAKAGMGKGTRCVCVCVCSVRVCMCACDTRVRNDASACSTCQRVWSVLTQGVGPRVSPPRRPQGGGQGPPTVWECEETPRQRKEASGSRTSGSGSARVAYCTAMQSASMATKLWLYMFHSVGRNPILLASVGAACTTDDVANVA
jgi:hypothetical protein